jgi:hypothetical protein
MIKVNGLFKSTTTFPNFATTALDLFSSELECSISGLSTMLLVSLLQNRLLTTHC